MRLTEQGVEQLVLCSSGRRRTNAVRRGAGSWRDTAAGGPGDPGHRHRPCTGREGRRPGQDWHSGPPLPKQCLCSRLIQQHLHGLGCSSSVKQLQSRWIATGVQTAALWGCHMMIANNDDDERVVQLVSRGPPIIMALLGRKYKLVRCPFWMMQCWLGNNLAAVLLHC